MTLKLNLAEYLGLAGAGGGGKVRRALVPGLVSEQREEYGFFGIGIDTEFGG